VLFLIVRFLVPVYCPLSTYIKVFMQVLVCVVDVRVVRGCVWVLMCVYVFLGVCL